MSNVSYPIPSITPTLGVKSFLKTYGTVAHVLRLLTQMGVNATRLNIEKWKKDNSMPRYVHEALKAIAIDDKQATADGAKMTALEIFIDGKFIGRLELPRNVEMVLKRRRHT